MNKQIFFIKISVGGRKRRRRWRELYLCREPYFCCWLSIYGSNFYLKTFFSQKILPMTPPYFWKRGRGSREVSENIIIIAKNRRCRRHSSLKVIGVKKSMIFNNIFFYFNDLKMSKNRRRAILMSQAILISPTVLQLLYEIYTIEVCYFLYRYYTFYTYCIIPLRKETCLILAK